MASSCLPSKICSCDLIWKKCLCSRNHGWNHSGLSEWALIINSIRHLVKDKREDTDREDSHVKMDTVVQVMQPQAKQSWEPLEAGRGKSLPYRFGGLRALPSHWFRTSGLQNNKRINFCFFEPPNLWVFVTIALENQYIWQGYFNVWRNFQTYFESSLYHFTFPLSMHGVPVFPYPCQYFILSVFFYYSHSIEYEVVSQFIF